MATPGHIEADSVPMYVLADPLTDYLGRKVVDKTGLTGNYNFTLRWTNGKWTTDARWRERARWPGACGECH
jgi:uncharacterized protein (TIGR03435 family)